MRIPESVRGGLRQKLWALADELDFLRNGQHMVDCATAHGRRGELRALVAGWPGEVVERLRNTPE